MTVIAAISDGTTCWMAADSATTDGHGRMFLKAHDKIVRATAGSGGEVLVGVAGYAALTEAIRHHWKIDGLPNPDDDADCDVWAYAAAKAITSLAFDAEPRIADRDGDLGIDALMAYAGRLWLIRENCAMRAFDDGRFRYQAIGSGGELALGSLYAVDDDPARRLARAVSAACEFHDGCRPPINMHVLAHPSEV